MISVVLATHNEEKNIKRCLDSVKYFADEIIIVDGESTDNTLVIAKKFGAKIIKTTNKPNFHINKQMAMDATKGELVLQMDADEVVDKKLAKFITKTAKKIKSLTKKELKSHPKAWWLKRKNLFLKTWLKKGGQYPDPVIRLYINGYAKLPQKDVHEQMVVDGDVMWAEGHLLHYSNPSFEDYMRKFNAYTTLRAHQLNEKKLNINLKTVFMYLFWKPLATFFSLFVRHRGYVDGVAGFVFALFSGFYHTIAYLKLWELKLKK